MNSVPSSCASVGSYSPINHSIWRQLPVRAQRFSEEGGRSSPSDNLVDANLAILRKRIDEVKVKERLERSCRCGLGWNYNSGSVDSHPYKSKLRDKRTAVMSELFELVLLIGGNVGLTIVACTILLCLTSLFIHVA